jgi:hypothetical protein
LSENHLIQLAQEIFDLPDLFIDQIPY